jgi:acetyl esterase/lipase
LNAVGLQSTILLFRYSHLFVTSVKTGVHPLPKPDTVSTVRRTLSLIWGEPEFILGSERAETFIHREYEAALKANNVKYEAYVYPKTNHGFHNDTTPRFDEAAAKLAWQRTIDHFNKTLKS